MDFETPITVWQISIRLAAAALCGAVVGWEREAHRKPAGLRTNMLVCMGSAVFTVISLNIIHHVTDPSVINSDPIRLVSGIISGIGFLGAGAILRNDGTVHGITTAATVWVVGSVGIACGLGLYKVASVATFFTLVILAAIGFLSDRLNIGDAEDSHDSASATPKQDA